MLNASFFLRWLCLVALAVALVGCADTPAKTGTRADENKRNLVNLKADMPTEEVTTLMGPPDKIVRHRGKNNERVVTYLYITQYIETYTSRGWDKNNYTPLIFINDRLSGWGWNELDRAAQQHEFDIKTTPFLAPSP